MKIKELIGILQQFNPELPIVIELEYSCVDESSYEETASTIQSLDTVQHIDTDGFKMTAPYLLLGSHNLGN